MGTRAIDDVTSNSKGRPYVILQRVSNGGQIYVLSRTATQLTLQEAPHRLRATQVVADDAPPQSTARISGFAALIAHEQLQSGSLSKCPLAALGAVI